MSVGHSMFVTINDIIILLVMPLTPSHSSLPALIHSVIQPMTPQQHTQEICCVWISDTCQSSWPPSILLLYFVDIIKFVVLLLVIFSRATYSPASTTASWVEPKPWRPLTCRNIRRTRRCLRSWSTTSCITMECQHHHRGRYRWAGNIEETLDCFCSCDRNWNIVLCPSIGHGRLAPRIRKTIKTALAAVNGL